MRIAKDTNVTLKMVVSDEAGQVLDAGGRVYRYVHGGHQGIFPKIEAALEGCQVGDRLTLALAPREAFGDYDPALRLMESVDHFASLPAKGDVFERDWNGAPVVFRVCDVVEGRVDIDGNHPLAGLTLTFDVSVLAVTPMVPEIPVSDPVPVEDVKGASQPGRLRENRHDRLSVANEPNAECPEIPQFSVLGCRGWGVLSPFLVIVGMTIGEALFNQIMGAGYLQDHAWARNLNVLPGAALVMAVGTALRRMRPGFRNTVLWMPMEIAGLVWSAVILLIP